MNLEFINSNEKITISEIKSNAEDSMMRVQSKKIAMELMGLTFGKES